MRCTAKQKPIQTRLMLKFSMLPLSKPTLFAKLGPNYQTYADAIASFPFDKLTPETKAAFTAVTTEVNFYLILARNQSSDVLNSLWWPTNGQRTTPTRIDSWFTNTFLKYVQSMQGQVKDSNEECP